ncbi:MAG TPA: hypothetical protein VGS19_18785 [Streptosporangiaceae bacterium]|nr:hypothetical protein [Streptosporangiaceae bacterium]
MKHRISAKTASAAAVAAMLVVLAPTAASAAPRPKVATSTQYAGWALPHPPSVTSAGTTFIVPNLTCTATNATVVPGVGVVVPGSIIASGVALSCSGGRPLFMAETDIRGVVTPLPVPVRPGDKIITSLNVNPTLTTGMFADVTRGFSVPIRGRGGLASLTCVGIDGTHQSPVANPVPNFGHIVFTATTIDGRPIGSLPVVRINMATSTGVLQISTGPIGPTPTMFTSTFVNIG